MWKKMCYSGSKVSFSVKNNNKVGIKWDEESHCPVDPIIKNKRMMTSKWNQHFVEDQR